MNSFGRLFRLTTFGESHGTAIGGVLDGCPSGIKIDLEEVQRFLSYRRPGTSSLVSPRREEDRVTFLSGLLPDNTTTGHPIGFIIHNEDARGQDYSSLSTLYRPSHADYTYHRKYGIPPQSGGGRASARETAVRCVAGAIALQMLRRKYNIEIYPYIYSIGEEQLKEEEIPFLSLEKSYSFRSRCPHPEADKRLSRHLLTCATQGDSIGGIVECLIKGTPMGWGSPLYDKLHARLAYAMLSINAVKGIEFGDGFALARSRGSQVNDAMGVDDAGKVYFKSNHSGGIQGGIATGEVISFRVAFKPTPTIGIEQESVTIDGKETIVKGKGRHDPCVAIRGVSVVHAMTALVLADEALIAQTMDLFSSERHES